MSDLLVLSAEDVTSLFDLESAIASQRRAFTELGSGHAVLAPKAAVEGADGALALNYTARTAPDAAAVAKLVGVHPANAARGLATIHGLVVVLDADTGVPAAVMDGTSVTTRRTAAGSAVAVDALAPAGEDRLVVVGAGVQARSHVHAVAHVRPLAEVVVVGRDASRAGALAADLAAESHLDVTASTDIRGAVADGGVVALCTTSHTPVVEHGWLAPGTTLVSIGSFAPDRAEVPQQTLADAALVVVDERATAIEHAGPVVEAVRSARLAADDLVELGDVLTGRHAGRGSDDDIVFYNSVGVGVQDAAAAETVVRLAADSGRGRKVEL